MWSAQSFERESVEVLPALFGWSGRKVLVNPNQVVNKGLQSKAVRIGAVIPIVNAWVAFRGQDVGVTQHLVDDDFLAVVKIGVVVFDERNGIHGSDSGQADMVQICHVEATWRVAHLSKDKLQRKIEGIGPALHPGRIEDPSIDQNAISVKVFSDREFSVH